MFFYVFRVVITVTPPRVAVPVLAPGSPRLTETETQCHRRCVDDIYGYHDDHYDVPPH